MKRLLALLLLVSSPAAAQINTTPPASPPGTVLANVPFKATGGTTATGLAQRFGHLLNIVDDFGAPTNGTSDSYGAIAAAVAVGGGVLSLPTGTYKMSAKVTVPSNVCLVGSAKSGGTVIVPSTDITPLSLGSSSVLTQGACIKYLSIVRTGTVTGGDAIDVAGAINSQIEHVTISGTFNGIAVGPSANTLINDVNIVGANANGGNVGLYLYKGTSPGTVPTIPTTLTVQHTWVSGAALAGWHEALYLTAGEDIHFANSYFGQATDRSVYISQGADNANILNVTFGPGTYIDAATNGGAYITGASGDGSIAIRDIFFNGAQINASGGGSGDAIAVDATNRGGSYPIALHGLTIANSVIEAWPHNGVNIAGAVDVSITGNRIRGNNYANAGTFYGVVLGAAVTKANVAGNIIGGDAFGNDSASAFQTYGIITVAGAANWSATDNNLTGNVTGGIADGTTATTQKYYANNVGAAAIYITSNVEFGAAVALTSATAKTITSITLGPGDWRVWGGVGFSPTGATTMTSAIGSLSLTDNTDGTTHDSKAQLQLSATNVVIMPLTAFKVFVASGATTAVYLVANANFAGGTATCGGFGFMKAELR